MGQRQLFYLERALLRRCHILVLDEDTTSIDNAIDAILQKTIEDRIERLHCYYSHTPYTESYGLHYGTCTMVLAMREAADLVLWRNKKISGGVLAGATAIWLLFEVMEYHLLTLVCHCLILSLAILFLWSNASTFINKSPPNIPEVKIPEDVTVNIALSLRYEINRGFATLREIGHGRDLKKFLIVIAGLWVLSVLGSCCNILTLSYIVFVVLYTVPVLYEKYEDKVDAFGEKAMIELKKYYAIFEEKCLSKIPKGPSKDKKH